MGALPEMGQFLLMDTFGIGTAIVMLRRSMDPGKYGDTIQYDTLQKYRSAFSNVWVASVYTMQGKCDGSSDGEVICHKLPHKWTVV